jgi:D-lyxose ketol-isomerase
VRRSEINDIIRRSASFMEGHGFSLPPFAYWSPEELQARATSDAAAIVSGRLGWDVTDYGKGNFARHGLVLFALRNNSSSAAGSSPDAGYAEKLMICASNQSCQLHKHAAKSGDIVNRGGGMLVVRVFGSRPDGPPDEMTDVVVTSDGQRRALKAGASLRLAPGASVTLPAGLWHAFGAEDGDVLVGEISTLNDDHSDNFFTEPVGRFLTVDEDTVAERLLVSDYDSWIRPQGKAPAVEAHRP